MKKLVSLIIFFMFLNNASYATGVLFAPQSGSTSSPASTPSSTSTFDSVASPTSTPSSTSTSDSAASPSPSFSPSFSPSPSTSTSPMLNMPNAVGPEKVFQPIIEPIRKTEESKKALVAGTSAEISKYQKISLPDAIKYAMAHNLNIIGTRVNVDIAKNDIKKANRLQNPYIQAFWNTGKASTDNPDQVGMILPFEIAKRGPRKNLAKAALELTKGNVLLAELNLRLEVRQAYIDLVSAKSNLRILDGQKNLLQELLYIAQKKYDAGAVPQMDVVQAKMTLNQLLIQVNTANTNVYIARYKFNILLDPQRSDFDTVEDYLPEQNKFISILTPQPTDKMVPFEELFGVAQKKRIDLQNAEKEIQVAQKNLVVVMRQRVPDIEIGGGPLMVPPSLSTASEFTKGIYVAGNITNIPLFYLYNPEIRNARLQIEQKQLAYAHLKHQAEMDLHSAYYDFVTKRDNLNYYNDILLSESKQFLGMAKRSYIVGKSSLTDLIFIEQSYRNIMMGYISALSDYYNSWIDILQELNDEDFKMNQDGDLKSNG